MLAAVVGSMSAQSLSVQPVEVQAGGQTQVVVSLTGGTAATALQFNLRLPEGLTANANSTTLGTATDGHTLSVQTLDSGDLLFVLYSTNLNTFMDGELLRLVNDLNRDALMYWRDLGLTPAGLKKINDKALTKTKKSTLASALKELS